MPLTRPSSSPFGLGALALCLASCQPAADPTVYTIAVMSPTGNEPLPDLDWAASKVNAAGIGGEGQINFELHDTSGLSVDQKVALAESLALDEGIEAVITEGGSDDLLRVVPVFVDARKPVLTATDSAGELLRAFSGTTYLWRTRINELIQTEFILRDAEDQGIGSLALLSSLTHGGQTFFDWFGFYARDLGYSDATLSVGTFAADTDCGVELDRLLEASPELLVVAATLPEELDCVVNALDARRLPDGSLPTRVELADLGLNARDLLELEYGERAAGLEGWVAGTPEAEQLLGEWEQHSGEGGLPWTGVAGHDAVLLVAYGLERRLQQGGDLATAITDIAHGAGAPTGWDTAGVADTLARLRAGELPDISGAGGPLTYDPTLNIDVIEGVMTRWVHDYDDQGQLAFRFGRGVEIGTPRMHDEADEGAFEEHDGLIEGYVPPNPSPSGAKALLLAASPGWENYRHQADALARYQRLRGAGFSDADIIMIGADDIANHPQNAAPGQVRNRPGGPDVYAGVTYDYGSDITVEQLGAILRGEVGPDTPEVLELDSGTNLYIYVAGHGGLFGLGLGANTAEAGLGGATPFWEPQQLTEVLCTLRAEDRVRRVLFEIETCHGGVYGDANFFGLEGGCEGGATPLSGVLAISAATPTENSLGAGWDPELQQWVGDEFSIAMLDQLTQASTDLASLHRAVYLSVAGSHVSAYNAAHYGELYELGTDEFFVAP